VIAYAGVPITDADGAVVGSLCAIDSRPRTWSEEDLAVLTDQVRACSLELLLRAAQQRADEAVRQAHELLAQQEVDRSRWSLALDAGQVGTFDMDLATGALTVDDRLLELSGMDRAGFTGRPENAYAHVHPGDVADVVAGVEHAITTGGSYQAEYRVSRADDSYRWVAAQGRVLGDEPDRRLVGVVHDSSAQRELHERTAQIVDSMAGGFIATDADWVMTHVNSEAERLTGSRRKQLLGRTLWEAFPATVGQRGVHHAQPPQRRGRER
jgi:PAS domain-containing protein